MDYSTSKMLLKGSDSKDRLSELPDEILVHILSFLPILDAVRTVSIRRFGDLWTLIPSLHFDDSELLVPKYWPRGKTTFPIFVRNVLLSHKKTPIDKFMLSFLCEDDSQSIAHEITTWIRYAIDRQVKALYVQHVFLVELDRSLLPRRLFTSQSLVTLELDTCRIDDLSKVQMGSLRILSLNSVKMSNEVFKKIVLGCPSLVELTLSRLDGLDEVRFTAPNIEKLLLHCYNGLLDCPNLKILDISSTSETPMQMLNLSSVCEANISWCYNINVFDEYLKKFSNAEVFKYYDGAFQSTKVERDLPQTRWKRLHINSWLCGDRFSGICRVLRSSPHLEELIVYTDSPHDLVRTLFDAKILSEELCSCLMQQLKTVTIRGYEVPCHGVLQLAGFLLRSSIALEKMVILPYKEKSAAVTTDEVKFLKQLLSFPRASTNAKLIFGSIIY